MFRGPLTTLIILYYIKNIYNNNTHKPISHKGLQLNRQVEVRRRQQVRACASDNKQQLLSDILCLLFVAGNSFLPSTQLPPDGKEFQCVSSAVVSSINRMVASHPSYITNTILLAIPSGQIYPHSSTHTGCIYLCI